MCVHLCLCLCLNVYGFMSKFPLCLFIPSQSHENGACISTHTQTHMHTNTHVVPASYFLDSVSLYSAVLLTSCCSFLSPALTSKHQGNKGNGADWRTRSKIPKDLSCQVGKRKVLCVCVCMCGRERVPSFCISKRMIIYSQESP